MGFRGVSRGLRGCEEGVLVGGVVPLSTGAWRGNELQGPLRLGMCHLMASPAL